MHAADPVIRQAMAKEGAVTAIVLDHEQPHEKAGSRHRDQQGEPPIAEMNQPHISDPERHERHEGDGKFDQCCVRGSARDSD